MMLRLIFIFFAACVIVKIFRYAFNGFRNGRSPLINLPPQQVKPELFIADEINKLSRLLKDGVLTEAEFLTQKNKLLTRGE